MLQKRLNQVERRNSLDRGRTSRVAASCWWIWSHAGDAISRSDRFADLSAGLQRKVPRASEPSPAHPLYHERDERRDTGGRPTQRSTIRPERRTQVSARRRGSIAGGARK